MAPTEQSTDTASGGSTVCQPKLNTRPHPVVQGASAPSTVLTTKVPRTGAHPTELALHPVLLARSWELATSSHPARPAIAGVVQEAMNPLGHLPTDSQIELDNVSDKIGVQAESQADTTCDSAIPTQ